MDCREAILSFFLGRIGTLAADYFCGSRRFGRFGGFCGARGSGPGKADARLIAIGELDTGCLECRCSASIVCSFNSSPRSNLATVSIDTLAAAASSRTPKPSAARAMRRIAWAPPSPMRAAMGAAGLNGCPLTSAAFLATVTLAGPALSSYFIDLNLSWPVSEIFLFA